MYKIIFLVLKVIDHQSLDLISGRIVISISENWALN